MADPVLPSWADELRHRYLAGESSLFLLHGNVRDLQGWRPGDGTVEFVGLRDFLDQFLGRTREIVARYDVSQGLRFAHRKHERLFRTVIDAKRAARGEARLGALPLVPGDAIAVIEDLITEPAHSSAVVIDFFEMIAPRADVSFMSHDDKSNLVSLQRWASDPAFLTTDNTVILITDHLSDISRKLVASPSLGTIHLPFPNLQEREAFLEHLDLTDVPLEMDVGVLAKMTAGLSLIQIRSLIRGAQLRATRAATRAEVPEPLTFQMVSARKKSIIEQECQGLVEFVAPVHDFSHVGGMAGVKQDLTRVADAVKRGHHNRVPMGMIFVGPMGTGKTFIAEAFASESGLTCLKLKNFRDKWVGSTESNLEKVLELVEALGYVLLIVDEADRGLSSGSGSDGGVNSRVIARLKEFMSDTSHRGRVVILMMTNRPDKLDTDLKRPGRFDLKIPFFFPEEEEERLLILQALLRKNHLVLADEATLEPVAEKTDGYSGAELEAVLLAAAALSGQEDHDAIGAGHLEQAVLDVIPSRDTRMLEYMELLAVFEASSRRMLPERHRDLSTEEVQARLDRLRAQLGRRL